MCVCVKPWSYLNVEMNFYLFTWKTAWMRRPQGWSSKTAPRKDRRGRARNRDGGKRAQNKDWITKEGKKREETEEEKKVRKEGGTALRSRTESRLGGRRRAPFTILREETHTSTHKFPLPPTSVCVGVSSCNIKKAVCVGIKSGGTGMQWIIYHYWFAHTQSYTNTSAQTHTHY